MRSFCNPSTRICGGFQQCSVRFDQNFSVIQRCKSLFQGEDCFISARNQGLMLMVRSWVLAVANVKVVNHWRLSTICWQIQTDCSVSFVFGWVSGQSMSKFTGSSKRMTKVKRFSWFPSLPSNWFSQLFKVKNKRQIYPLELPGPPQSQSGILRSCCLRCASRPWLPASWVDH